MPETPSVGPLSDSELEIWGAVATLLQRLPAALDAQLQRDSGLSHFEHGILFALQGAEDSRLRLSVLAGYANCTLSRLSRAASRLEAKGWMRREIDPADGRFTLGILTPAGRHKIAESTPAHQALVRHAVFDSLTPAQARQFASASRKISAALNPHEMWRPAP